MEVVCKTNEESSLPEELRDVAYTQEVGTGVAEITPGKAYKVYGVRTVKDDVEYFILTDNKPLPWWMSSHFFDGPRGDMPDSWQTKRYQLRVSGSDIEIEIIAPPAFHEAYESGGEEQIIDGDPEGYEIFTKMRKETGY